MKRLLRNTPIFIFALMLVGCTAENTKKRYILAEKLWGDGDYAGAVSEFDKVTRRDPKGKLGLQALFRAAMTQTLFLSQHQEAIRKLKIYLESATDPKLIWIGQVQIGDILFSKLGAYDEAVLQYRALLEKYPDVPEAPEFLFRIGRSHFFRWEFGEAISIYKEITTKYPNTSWAERAQMEIGVSYFTSGEQRLEAEKGGNPYQQSIQAYEEFLRKHPKSELAPQARFGIASCLEEMDQLEAAAQKYEEIQKTYPSPKVVSVKLMRIRERLAQRRH